jgi:hypothetical protein
MLEDEAKRDRWYIGMSDRSVEEKVPYQSTLRQIGRYLDEHPSRHFNLLELPDGYAVRYEIDDSRMNIEATFFTWEMIFDMEGEALPRREAQKGIRLGRNTGAYLERAPNGYEEFLRSLGYELDTTGAYTIALDELDAGIVITYLFIDARTSYVPQKQSLYLSPEETDRVMGDAFSRRAIPDDVLSQDRKRSKRLLS